MFEFEGGAGDVLCGQFQLHVGGADFVKALEHGAVGKVGTVAFAAQVTEVNMDEVGRHDFLRGGGGVVVGKMAVAAGDALFEAPGAAGFLQHFQVVIGFEEQDIGGANALEDGFGGVAEVRQNTDFSGGGVQEEADGVGGVVRDVKGVHVDVADIETGAGFEDAAFKFRAALVFDGVFGGAVAVNGDFKFVGKAGETVDVVGVLVGDQNSVEFFRNAADGGEAFGDLAVAEAGVNEQAGVIGLQISAIAAGAAA